MASLAQGLAMATLSSYFFDPCRYQQGWIFSSA